MNGLYIGSFDMFTNGHLDILEQAVPLFDKIHVVIGINDAKTRRYTIESSKQFIHSCIKDKSYIDKIVIDSTDMIASKYAQENNLTYIIRGIRNVKDYMFEEELAQFYKDVNPDVNVIYFYANNKNISSSMVKILLDNNENYKKYLSGDISLLRKYR